MVFEEDYEFSRCVLARVYRLVMLDVCESSRGGHLFFEFVVNSFELVAGDRHFVAEVGSVICFKLRMTFLAVKSDGERLATVCTVFAEEDGFGEVVGVGAEGTSRFWWFGGTGCVARCFEHHY